jgi:hypothetical protein
MQILGAAGPLYRAEMTDEQWRKQQRRIARGGQQALPIPVVDGRVVYTTAAIGHRVADLAGQFAADLLAMADDKRRMRATGTKEQPGWRQAWQAFSQVGAPREPTGEHVGISGAKSMPYARMLAAEYGILEHVGDDQHLVIRDVRESDPATWYLFAERIGIRKWAPRQAEVEVKAA